MPILENEPKEETKEPQIEWPDHVPEVLRVPENKALADYKSLEDALSGLVSTKRMVATTRRVPDFEKATAEEVDKFWHGMGTPTKAEEYLEKMGLSDEAKQFMGDDLGAIADAAHKARMPADMLSKTLKGFTEGRLAAAQERVAQLKGMMDADEAYLKNHARGDYDAVVGAVQDFAKKSPLYDERLHNALMQNGLTNHPLIVLGMHALAEREASGRFPKAEPRPSGVSVSDLDAQIAALQKDEAFLNSSHPRHGDAVRRNLDLYKARSELSARQ